jgi:competence protein ComGC
MSRKLLIALISVFIIVGLAGCKKTSTTVQDESADAVKTQAEYTAQAEQEITKENMAGELDKLEQGIEQDSAAEN